MLTSSLERLTALSYGPTLVDDTAFSTLSGRVIDFGSASNTVVSGYTDEVSSRHGI